MPYQIGQYRFRGVGTCTQAVESSKNYKNIAMTGEDVESASFRDVVITTTSAMMRNTDYYLYVKIPQDMNYNLTFNIKLIKQELAGAETQYQFLKNITIPRGGSGTNVYNVALYQTASGEVRAMIPEPYVAGAQNVQNYLYRDSNTGNYYLGNGNTTYTPTQNYNDLMVTASWIRQTGENFGYAEIVFRPVEDNFSQIILEMVRTAEDYNIQSEDASGTTLYGRFVPLESLDYKLYALTNLVNDINPNGSLSRIGVWGHSGLLMAINGEEIRVGASNYYELDNILPVTSLGIVADGYDDNFSIDYQYEITQEGGE